MYEWSAEVLRSLTLEERTAFNKQWKERDTRIEKMQEQINRGLARMYEWLQRREKKCAH